MGSIKLNKKQLREKKITEDRRFMRTLSIRFGLLFLLLGLILVFFTYWCDTKYAYRKIALFGKEIPAKLICMNGNTLVYHDNDEFMFNGKKFFVCSEGCKKNFISQYDKVAFIADALTGDTICKADAIIGFKERGKPSVVYFKNLQNFYNYYKAE